MHEDEQLYDSLDSEIQGLEEEAADTAKSIGRKAGGKAIKAGKAVAKTGARAGKLLIKGIIKGLVALVSALGPLLFVVLLFIIVLFTFLYNFRGASFDFLQDTTAENPVVMNDDGIYEAQALTVQNAYIDAYYKYMSLGSFRKYYNGKILEFGDTDDKGKKITTDDREDFASLTDYNNKEGYFYLNPYFIAMADEKLHNKEFFYPEGIIKPVKYELQDYEDPETGITRNLITAVPLIADPVTETDENGNEKEVGFRPLTATSKTYLRHRDAQDDGTTIETPYYDNVQTSNEELGVWDYGLGSMIQYEPQVKDKYMACNYTSITIHTHYHYYEEVDDGPDSSHYELVSECRGNQEIDISDCNTIEEIRAKISPWNSSATSHDVNDSWYTSMCPSSATLERLVNDGETTITQVNADTESSISLNARRINMPIEDIDDFIAKRTFHDADLKDFENNKTKPADTIGTTDLVSNTLKDSNWFYPINVAVVSSAATMSGNIKYSYASITTSEPISVRTGFAETDDATTLQYAAEGTCSLGNSFDALNITRQGEIITVVPSANEDDEPWGFDYLDAYAEYYENYIPLSVRTSIAFDATIESDTEKTDEEKYIDAKIGRIITPENTKKLEDLGLLIPYTGGGLDKIYTPTSYQVNKVALYLNNFNGESELTKRMLGAAYVNTWKQTGDFKNLASYGTPMDDEVSTENYGIAQEVLEGTFTIPSNVMYLLRNDEDQNGYDAWKILRLDGHDYSLSASGTVSNKDYGDRPVRSFDELESISKGEVNAEYAARDLYKVEPFDLNKVMRIVLGNAEERGFMDRIKEHISNLISGATDVFGSILKEDDKLVHYENRNVGVDIRETVYQAITFQNMMSYENAKEMLVSADDVSFLFVGQNAGLMMGTFMVQKTLLNEIGSTIKGFVSPTKDPYTVKENFAGDHDYVVLSAPKRAEVISVGNKGRVVNVDLVGSSNKGKYVEVRYISEETKAYNIIYGMLDEITVQMNDVVSLNQLIGYSGNEGLLFYVMEDGNTVNPMEYFYQKTWSYASMSDVLDKDGRPDQEKMDRLWQELITANNYRTGQYDKWHKDPVNKLLVGECVWYALGRACQYFESVGIYMNASSLPVDNGGYIIDRNNNLSTPMFNTGPSPKPNSLICWKDGGYGHVAYVEAVTEDGTIVVSQGGQGYKPNWGGIRVQAYTYQGGSNPYPYIGSHGTYQFVGFLYLDEPNIPLN